MTRAEREAVAAVAELLMALLSENYHHLVGGMLRAKDGIRRMEQVQRVMLPEDAPPQSTTAKEH